MLRVQVSRLRKALADGNGEPRLQARPPGYLLRVEHGELDLHAFEQRLAAGRQALADGDPARAAVLLREAESLWRGRPLADLEFEPFARLEVQRLEALRMQVVEDRIDAELALGRHAAVCPELEQLVTEHPLRERLRGQLMLALYRSGRQADALETYRAGRSLLVEELALEPGPQLRELELAMLEQDTALDLPRARRRRRPGHRHAPPADVPADRAAPGPDSGRAAPAGLASPSGSPDRAGARGSRRAGRLVLVPLSRHGTPPTSLNGACSRCCPASYGRSGDRAAASTACRRGGGFWLGVGRRADAGLVARVDPRGARCRHHPGRHQPGRVVAAGGRSGCSTGTRTLARIDPLTDTWRRRSRWPASRAMSCSAGQLWVASRADGTVLRIDPGTGRTKSVVARAGTPSSLAASDGAVWVATDGSGTLARIDARTGTVTNTIRVGDAPAAVAAGASGLWVLDPLDATVARVDPRRDAVTATIALGGQPAALAEAGGNIWIADRRDGTLLRLAPGQTWSTRFGFGGHLSALAAAGGGLWVAIDAAGASHRGGTLTASTPKGPSTRSTRPRAPRTTCPRPSFSA